MRYALVLVTHGRAPTLERTLESFAEMVTPRPHRLIAVVDGADARLPPLEPLGMMWEGNVHGGQFGFCASALTGWKAAQEAEDCDHIFWLENDFEFLRPVDLRPMADVLAERPHVLQMSLCRNACNAEEIEAGGLVASRRGWFHPQPGEHPWFEHGAYWTTNPSLFQRRVTVEHAWPEEPFCEGVFGIRVREGNPDLRFGLWGDGAEWVHHIGTRDGHGY